MSKGMIGGSEKQKGIRAGQMVGRKGERKRGKGLIGGSEKKNQIRAGQMVGRKGERERSKGGI